MLETFDFPVRVTDLNNVGQVCGGAYRGDLFGNYEDLSDTYEPGDVMPDWAIENGGISAGWHRINDQGWLVGRAGTGISDGAGHLPGGHRALRRSDRLDRHAADQPPRASPEGSTTRATS